MKPQHHLDHSTVLGYAAGTLDEAFTVVAAFLRGRADVATVLYPGFGGMVSFVPAAGARGQSAAARAVARWLGRHVAKRRTASRKPSSRRPAAPSSRISGSGVLTPPPTGPHTNGLPSRLTPARVQ